VDRDRTADRALAAIWLYKHRDELVLDCPLGIITQSACHKRLSRLAHKPERYAVGDFNLTPVGCLTCPHSKGTLKED
jgi:hypothetical protein